MAAIGIEPAIDYVFKRLFGSEENVDILIDLLNAILDLPPGRLVRAVELLNTFTDREYADQKVSILDIKARDTAVGPGRQYHLEMQRIVPWSFGKRVLYYWARLHGQQLLEGDFYETLGITYSICFITQKFFDSEEYHHVLEVRDVRTKVQLCKDLQIHVIDLSRFTLRAEEVQTGIERWCYFLKHGASLDPEHLPATLDVPIIRRALEVLMAVSRDERERIRIEDIMKGIRDANNLRYEAEHAEEIGFRRGEEKGVIIGQIHLAQKLLQQPLTPSPDLNKLQPDKLTELAVSLERQLSEKLNAPK